MTIYNILQYTVGPANWPQTSVTIMLYSIIRNSTTETHFIRCIICKYRYISSVTQSLLLFYIFLGYFFHRALKYDTSPGGKTIEI